jgi:hypothetical protein
MAIAFDNATDGGNTSTSPLQFNHTSTGTNLIGVVAIIGDVMTGADNITSVTWGGQTCSLVSKVTALIPPSLGNERFLYLYSITGPATGSQQISISSGTNHFLCALAATYTGVSQSGQPEVNTTHQSASETSSSLTTSLTTLSDNSWTVLAVESYDGVSAPAASTGATRRKFDAGFGFLAIMDSNGVITPAGSYSMTSTQGTGSLIGLSHIMAAIAPPSAGPNRFFILTHPA